MATATLGSTAYAISDSGRVRVDGRVFSGDLEPVDLQAIRFRFSILRPRQVISLAKAVESVSWTDNGMETPVLTGTMTVRQIPKVLEPRGARVVNGDVIRCEAWWFGVWREVWRMRVYAPDIEMSDGVHTLTLYDDLKLLMDTKDDLTNVFRKHKSGVHKRGWRAHEVAHWCAGHFHFGIDLVVKGRSYSKNLSLGANASAYKAIKTAYQHEANATGAQFTVRWNKGKLRVTHVTGKSVPYVFHQQMTRVLITNERKSNFCTALTLRATHKAKSNSHKKIKLQTRVVSQAAVKKYGYIHAVATTTTADTRAELLREAKRMLARRMYQKKVVTFDHPGVPFFRSGDACRIVVEDQGLTKLNSIFFARSVEHTVTSGSYSMTVVAVQDPLIERADTITADKSERDKKTKEPTASSESSATKRSKSTRKTR